MAKTTLPNAYTPAQGRIISSNWPANGYTAPVFKRREAAEILNIDPQTLRNREKAGTYPDPLRNHSNYREYSVCDILNLQYITQGEIAISPIVSRLWDKGFKNLVVLERCIKHNVNAYKEYVDNAAIMVANSEGAVDGF